MNHNADEILTPASLTRILKVKEQTLANWRSQGKGPTFFYVGGRPRYRMSAIVAYIKANEARSVSEGRVKKIVAKKICVDDQQTLHLLPYENESPLDRMTRFVQQEMKSNSTWFYRGKLLKLVGLIESRISEQTH